MYVCMDGWMDVCMHACIHGCMDVRMYGCMGVWMYGCMDVWMYVRTYVCMCGSWYTNLCAVMSFFPLSLSLSLYMYIYMILLAFVDLRVIIQMHIDACRYSSFGMIHQGLPYSTSLSVPGSTIPRNTPRNKQGFLSGNNNPQLHCMCKLERGNWPGVSCYSQFWTCQQKNFNKNAIAGLSTSDLLSSQPAVLQITWTRQHSTGHIHPFGSKNGWVFGKSVSFQKLDGEIMPNVHM